MGKLYTISIISVSVLIIVVLGFLAYRHIDSLEDRISILETLNSKLSYDIKGKESVIDSNKIYIADLEEQIQSLRSELAIMTFKYEEAAPYQERVETGQDITKSYLLLSDTNDYTKPIALNILGMNSPRKPANDEELWDRGRKIYNWMTNNYEYCGDKGLRIGTTFYQFQFWSPDEILVSDNARCGDCDDFAILFAGMMYASGVPDNKVSVVCGEVESGGHCWNWIELSDYAYRIDPVCSQKQTLLNILGLNLGIKGAYYTSTIENVQCFNTYEEQMKMNPDGFSLI